MFLEQLMQELDLLDPSEFKEPRGEIQPGEELVGICEEDRIKGLWTLQSRYQRESLLMGMDAETDGDVDGLRRAFCLRAKAEAVLEIMWAELREWNSNLAPCIGIREGWQIVNRPNIPEIIGRILG